MKTIHIRAYCGVNLGDDLFILQLLKRYPKHRFYLYALPWSTAAFRSAENLTLPTKADRVIRKATHVLSLPRKERFDGKGVDLSVTIGGSVLWENADISFGEPGIPKYLIGPNCDDNYSAAFLGKLREALAGTADCCFRDTYSYQLFESLPNVRYAPDVLFDWEPGQAPETGRGIGISVIAADEKKTLRDKAEAYYQTIAQVCDQCEALGIPVKLLGFCEAEGDSRGIDKVLEKVNNRDYPERYTYCGNVEAMTAQLNSCESIIATRFHAMILGWVLGKNVVPVIYSEKQSHVLNDVRFQGPVWNLKAGEQFSGEELLNAVQSEKGRLDITELKEKAGAQFAALDQVLKA